ncbi:phage protein Gp37 [Lonepinella sp. BR2474]|uniref:phage protein Gp37 n=1 Tax=Lonepinella sp. BR2474 TaxID=3434548 RepID=UPI003F6DE06F
MAIIGCLDVITKIENGLVERLTRGLGRLAATVKSYGGELDDKSLGTSRLPLVMVTYGGSRIHCKNIRAGRYQSEASFAVLVVTQSLRSNLAGRQGGVDSREIGANTLISAVRRLLDGQTLGGLCQPLRPMRIETLFNHAQVQAKTLTAYSLEYEAVFDDLAPLEDGRFPEVTQDERSADYVFNAYSGELSPEYGWLEQVTGKIFDPTTGATVPFEVETQTPSAESAVKK